MDRLCGAVFTILPKDSFVRRYKWPEPEPVCRSCCIVTEHSEKTAVKQQPDRNSDIFDILFFQQ